MSNDLENKELVEKLRKMTENDPYNYFGPGQSLETLCEYPFVSSPDCIRNTNLESWVIIITTPAIILGLFLFFIIRSRRKHVKN